MRWVWLIAAVGLCASLAPPAAAAADLPGARISATKILEPASYEGMQTLRYEYGPIPVTPGQNTIEIGLNDLKPDVPGYITRFEPGLVYTDTGESPRVDVVHLHHGVWLIDGYPTFAAGEEKTIQIMPQGYGLLHQPFTPWLMNHMVHNLRPTATSVKITYEIDFVPLTEPAALDITPVRPLWLDVAGIVPYPVFDALRGMGDNGRYTFPDDAVGEAAKAVGWAQEWIAPVDVTLVSTAGHLHPGGLYNDLELTRGGEKTRLFRSRAKYFEPAGAVSWDVAMTASRPEWAVEVKAGDTLSTSTTYDVSKASWYESMGIMVVFYALGRQPGATEAFSSDLVRVGDITHGHLPENDNHGGGPLGLPNPLETLSGAPVDNVMIKDFVYKRGNLAQTGKAGRPPLVKPGDSMQFTNLDATPDISPAQSAYHTITSCRAPCNKLTGIAYPLANAGPKRMFDSGQLGYGPKFGNLPFTSAAQRHTWDTPSDLPKGTYSYFCRVHPFMRGAFRVGRK